MARKANKTLIGGFVLAALVLLVASIVYFGSGRFFREVTPAVLYFEGSVKGLNIGAPVDFRGVTIGAVKEVKLLADIEAMELSIPVFIEIYPERIARKDDAHLSLEQKRKNFKKLIDKGLRARLEVQSFVTGQLMISLNLHPASPVRLVGDGSVLEIPTLPSTFEELSRTLENIKFEEIMANLNKAIEGIESIVSSVRFDQITLKVNDVLAEVHSSVDNLSNRLGILIDSSSRLVRGIEGLVNKVDTRVQPTFSSLNQTLASADAAARQANTLMQEAQGSLADDSLIMTELAATLRNLSAAARSIRALADYMERHPESIISGKGGY